MKVFTIIFAKLKKEEPKLTNLRIIILLLILGAIPIIGCDQNKPDEDTGKVPLEVREAEAMDATCLDAATDSVVFDTAHPDQDAEAEGEAGGE